MYENVIMIQDLFEHSTSVSNTYPNISTDKINDITEILSYRQLLPKPFDIEPFIDRTDGYILVIDKTFNYALTQLSNSYIHTIIPNIKTVIFSCPFTMDTGLNAPDTSILNLSKFLTTQIFPYCKDLSIIFDNVVTYDAYNLMGSLILDDILKGKIEVSYLNIPSSILLRYILDQSYNWQRIIPQDDDTCIEVRNLAETLLNGTIKTLSICECFYVDRKLHNFASETVREDFYSILSILISKLDHYTNLIFQQIPPYVNLYKQIQSYHMATKSVCYAIQPIQVPDKAYPLFFISDLALFCQREEEELKQALNRTRLIYHKHGTKSFVCQLNTLSKLLQYPECIINSHIYIQMYGKECKQPTDYLARCLTLYQTKISSSSYKVLQSRIYQVLNTLHFQPVFYLFLLDIEDRNLSYTNDDCKVSGFYTKQEKIYVMQLNFLKMQRYSINNINVNSYNYFIP